MVCNLVVEVGPEATKRYLERKNALVFEWAYRKRRFISKAVTNVLMILDTLLQMEIAPSDGRDSVDGQIDRDDRRLVLAGPSDQGSVAGNIGHRRYGFENFDEDRYLAVRKLWDTEMQPRQPVSRRLDIADYLVMEEMGPDDFAIRLAVLMERNGSSDKTDIEKELEVEFVLASLLGLPPGKNKTTIVGTNKSDIFQSGNRGPPLFVELERLLERENEPIPLGLENASIVIKELPFFVERFFVPAPKWLYEEWPECPTKCGEHNQTRTVECSRGQPLGCIAEDGPVPSSMVTCVDYSGCPFDIFCPWGKGLADLPCEDQEFTVLVASGGTFMCCTLCWCAYCIWMCRPPKHGRHYMHDIAVTAEYNVQRPGEGQPNEQAAVVEPERSQRTAATGSVCSTGSQELEGPIGKPEDQKPRIVWKVDVDKVEEIFRQQREEREKKERENETVPNPEAEQPQSPGPPLSPRSPRPPLEQENPLLLETDTGDTGADTGAKPGAIVPILHHTDPSRLVPMYENGASVEYHSFTHNTWLRATVTHKIVVSEDDPEMSPKIVYNLVPSITSDRG